MSARDRREKKRGQARSGLARWLVVGAGAVVALLAFLVFAKPEWVGLPRGPRAVPPRAPRVFKGVVLHGREPVADATVVLYENVAAGYRTEVTTGFDGTFEATWRPTATEDLGALFLAATDPLPPGTARTIVPARAAGVIITLADAVDVAGRVVDPGGEPIAGARVRVLVHHGETARDAGTDDDGRFVAENIASGAPLHIVASPPGGGPLLDSRFRAGDPVVIHVPPPGTFSVRAVDPSGRPIAAARARIGLPLGLAEAARETDGDGGVTFDGVPDTGLAHVVVEHDGYLPAEVTAAAGTETRVVMWPVRRVKLAAWDDWNRRPVTGVELEVAPYEWQDLGGVGRSYPMRIDGDGRYVLDLPACKVGLRVSAPGYAAEKVVLDAARDEVRVRLTPPRQRRKPAYLAFRAAEGMPDLALIVADDQGAWVQRAPLVAGEAEVEVPSGRPLQFASEGAARGVWVRTYKLKPLREGERRTVAVYAQPATRLTVRTEPVATGAMTLVDDAQKNVGKPVTAPVRDGVAVFWVRPLRKVTLSFLPEGNFTVWTGAFSTERDTQEAVASLRRGAGLRLRVRDRGGNAVPFATLFVWEPSAGGQMALRGRPRAFTADAAGDIDVGGLRSGDAAALLRARGFVGWRTASLKLRTGASIDVGTQVLAPARRIEGVVATPDGAPAPGVHVRVMPPLVAPLRLPGGGRRRLYDLTVSSLGDGVTDVEGRFRVPDAEPTAPMLAVYPKDGDFAEMPAPESEIVDGKIKLVQEAYVELSAPGSIEGVYLLVGARDAVLVKTDPPMSLRPLPVVLPAGKRSLFVRLRDGRWAAAELTLPPGGTVKFDPEYRR